MKLLHCDVFFSSHLISVAILVSDLSVLAICKSISVEWDVRMLMSGRLRRTTQGAIVADIEEQLHTSQGSAHKNVQAEHSVYQLGTC
jgi:hypothetical protein